MSELLLAAFGIKNTNRTAASPSPPSLRGKSVDLCLNPWIWWNDDKSGQMSGQERQRRTEPCSSAQHSGSSGYICSVMWSDSKEINKITQLGPECYSISQLSDVFRFLPRRQNNTVFTFDYAAAETAQERRAWTTTLYCIRDWRGWHSYPCWWRQRETQLIPFFSIYFIPLCPCHIPLRHIYLNYDIFLCKVCCSFLKSKKMYYSLCSTGVGFLEGSGSLSALCAACFECHHREEASV